MTSRFDFTKAQRTLLNTAVSLDIIDAVELGCLISEHGSDFDAIEEDILMCAWASHHSDDKHAAWCAIRDAHFAAERAAA